LRKEVNKLMDLMDLATEKIRALDGECRRLKKQLYGTKSEKRKVEQNKSSSPTATKEGIKRERGAQDGHKGHGRKIPENLPVLEEFHELPEEKRCCKR